MPSMNKIYFGYPCHVVILVVNLLVKGSHVLSAPVRPYLIGWYSIEAFLWRNLSKSKIQVKSADLPLRKMH